MKNLTKHWLGMLVMVLVFGMMVIGCGDDSTANDFIGTWVGTFNNYAVTVVITGSSWSISIPNMTPSHFNSGTYVYNGNVGQLYDDGDHFGTATLVDNNTMSLTLNQNTTFPGTYSLTRQ